MSVSIERKLLRGDVICNIDLKDAYFAVPLSQNSQKYVRFQWKNLLYKFLCLYLGLSSAARVFTKINESSYNFTSETLYKNCSISRRYAPDGSLLRGTTNCFGYINISASELGVFNQNSKDDIGFDNDFGVSRRLVDWHNMTLSLPQEKVEKIKTLCRDLQSLVTVSELSKLIGQLSSTAVVTVQGYITPANLGNRSLERQLNQSK